VTIYLVAVLLLVIFFAIFDVFPLIGALRPGQFIQRPAEFVPGMIFLLAAVGYLIKGHWRVDAFEHWLVVALLIGLMAHGAYMPFSSQYHGAVFVAAHALKVFGYGSVLVGLLASVYVTFRREEEVAETTREANTALAREIDYRRQAERVIQESEERLQGFLDSAHDLIQSVDPQGRFIYVNRAWKEVLGYTDEDLEDLTFFEVLAPTNRQRCRRDFERILAGEDLPVLEVDFIAADGRTVQCSGSTDVWTKDGEAQATRSIFRDITEQLQTRRELESFQANLKALVENTGDAIWSVDRDMRLITFNTAFSMSMEVRTNREPEVGDRPEDCLPPVDVGWYEEMYQRSLFGETFSELRDEDIGGQVRSYEFFFNPIRDSGGITGVAAFGQDVTARRRTQLALHMAKEEAEHANQAKSQFLASMSHELRTPLNSVIGFTNILLKNRSGNLADQELGFLERIIANGKHLLELINEVLDLAKIEAGRMELELGTVNLPELVEDTLGQLEGQVKGRDVVLRGIIPETLDPIETDAGKLKQVIINLVGNALKFTPQGEVTVIIDVQEDGRTPRSISVRDTGIGIPPDRLKAIFEAFQQADGSTSREYGGTGLGLTISRSLCQLMGFDLRVESEVDVGSTFTVLLLDSTSAEKRAERLLMEEALKPIESSRPSSERGGGRGDSGRILVVDDDPKTREVLSSHLREMGYEVLTAPSAELGIRAARTENPDLITLDLIMPEMSGWEALKAFKEERDLRDIPVVIVSVIAGEQDKGSLLGAVDLLTKPVDRDDLMRVLRRNLREPRGRKVLVVEDEETTQALFRNQLEEVGLEVAVAGNGQEAEEVMEEFAPDLILLDLVMPVMDGTAFLQRLRQDARGVNIPVVICTGKELRFEERRRLLAQASDVLEKGNDLEKRLKRVLASHLPAAPTSAPPPGDPEFPSEEQEPPDGA
jgi:PAS domain S-box-containing protein